MHNYNHSSPAVGTFTCSLAGVEVELCVRQSEGSDGDTMTQQLKDKPSSSGSSGFGFLSDSLKQMFKQADIIKDGVPKVGSRDPKGSLLSFQMVLSKMRKSLTSLI